MATNKGWIIAGVLIGGTLGIYLYAKKKKKMAPKPAVIPPPGGTPGPGAPAGTTPGQPPGPAGTNVYSKAGLTIRSSPQIDDGWFGSGFLGNLVTTISSPNVFVGNIVNNTADSNGAADPGGNIYTWYQINLAPALQYPGQSFYVREDYVTIK